jgi:hypothetical protein
VSDEDDRVSTLVSTTTSVLAARTFTPRPCASRRFARSRSHVGVRLQDAERRDRFAAEHRLATDPALGA